MPDILGLLKPQAPVCVWQLSACHFDQSNRNLHTSTIHGSGPSDPAEVHTGRRSCWMHVMSLRCAEQSLTG